MARRACVASALALDVATRCRPTEPLGATAGRSSVEGVTLVAISIVKDDRRFEL